MNLSSRRLISLAASTLLTVGCAHSGTDTTSFEILDQEWHLAGFENSLDLSGIAAASRDHVLVGSDEMFHIQPGVIDHEKKRIESRRPIALPVDNPGDKTEVDIEGVAYSPTERVYYVVGSHGLGKKKADVQPSRQGIFRVPVDPSTGKVDKAGIRRASLMPWLQKTPRVQPHLGQPLQLDGLNIEGLTWKEGRLWFGLRAPNVDGQALVLAADPAELFEGKSGRFDVQEIQVSKGRGIREITAVEGGFIVLTGNASAEASKKIPESNAPGPDTRFELLWWNGRDATARPLGRLPENGGKGEAMLVLEDTATHVDLLVVFDGLPGGEPLTVRISR